MTNSLIGLTSASEALEALRVEFHRLRSTFFWSQGNKAPVDFVVGSASAFRIIAGSPTSDNAQGRPYKVTTTPEPRGGEYEVAHGRWEATIGGNSTNFVDRVSVPDDSSHPRQLPVHRRLCNGTACFPQLRFGNEATSSVSDQSESRKRRGHLFDEIRGHGRLLDASDRVRGDRWVQRYGAALVFELIAFTIGQGSCLAVGRLLDQSLVWRFRNVRT